MTGPYDPPSDPQITRSPIKEAFGWETTGEVPASVQLGLSQAADTLGALQSTAQQAITQQWANAAVTTDILQGKIAHNIAGQLAASQNVVQALQQPIAMQVLGPLSQSVEATNALGTVPPMPGAEPSVPTCVVIRNAGTVGNLGPALEAYRVMAFQQRFTRGQQYNDVVSWIAGCLPPDQSIQEQYARAVLQLQNQPDTVPYAGAGGAATVAPPAGKQAASIPTPGGGATPESSQYVTVPGTNIGSLAIQQGSGPPPVLVIPGNPALTEPNPASGAPPVTAPSVAPGGSVPGSGAPPGYVYAPGSPILIPSSPGAPATPGFGSGAPPVAGNPVLTSPIAGSGAPPPQQQIPLQPTPGVTETPGVGPGGTTLCTNQFGEAWYIPAGQVCGSGPPPPSSGPALSPGYTPPTTEQPPAAPPPPGCPPPPKCPVPEKPACIKLCPDDTPKPPPKKCDYTAWCSASNGSLYVVRSDQPSRGVSDTKLATGDPTEWNWPALQSQCGQSPQQPGQEVPVAVVPVALPNACGEFGGAPGARVPGSDVSLAAILGLVNADGSPWVPFPAAGDGDIGKNIINYLATAFSGPLIQAAAVIQGVLSGNQCYDGAMSSLIGGDAVLGLAERWVGVNLDTYRIPNAYGRHFKCPVLLPSISEAASAWLAGEIDEKTLQCWVAANNGRYPEISTAIRAARTKLAPLQYAQLYMRDYIGQQDFQNRIRETGMIRGTDGDDLLNLLKVIPPPGDIISMMVKDAADTVNIDWSKEDAEFPQKYAGQLADWGRQQGVPQDYMQLLWRAHYSIPAPGQLYDMLHRLRPGNAAGVDPVTDDIARQALQQQDISPKWVDRLMAISYRPLTRIDAARAYKIGALNYDDLKSAYLDLGYNDTNAGRLADFQSKAADLQWQNNWSVKAYARGELNDADLENILTTSGATANGINLAKQRAADYGNSYRRKSCVAALKQRFLTGDLDLSNVQQALNGIGLGASQIDTLTGGWQCTKDARGRAIPASEVCGLYEIGALTIVDVVARLQRLGYGYDDAVLLARRCAQRVQDKLTKQEQQQLKAQQAADQKQARALARSAAAEARAIKQGQALAEKAAATRVAREKRLIEAGEKFSKHFAGSLPDSIMAVKSMFSQFQGQGVYTQDEIINALLVVTQSAEVSDLPSLALAMQAALAV